MLRGFSLKSRWWLAVLQVVLLLATLVTPAAAASEPLPLTGPQLIQLLREYNVVRGDDQGNLNLDKAISRAEMITIMVRALGKEEDAKLYKGFSPFPDAVGHWAETNIAYAHFAKLVKGDDQGRARPQDKITYAEALTLLLRALGKEPTTGEWPLNVLMAASDLGLVPEGVTYANIREYAIRGPIFATLAEGLLTVQAPSGKPFLAEYLDKTAPEITLDSYATPTLDPKISVSGMAPGASKVTINGANVTLTGSYRFGSTVDLAYGANTITVVATDVAGNARTQSLTVTRNINVAKIEITGPTTMAIGDTANIKATAYDAANQTANVAVTATVSGNAGTYNSSTGKFTASTAGTSTIAFKAGDVTKTHTVTVQGPSAKTVAMQIVPPTTPPNPNQNTTITVRMLDTAGNLVTEDNGRQIGLSASGLAGITITPTIARTVNGVATFTFSAGTGGQASLTAGTTDLPSANGQVMVATSLRIQITASPNNLYANGSGTSMIRANLVNSAGAPVFNTTNEDIVVQLTRGGVADGALSHNILTIKPGKSSSEGYDALYTSGFTAGTLYLNGDVVTGSAYTVLGTSITLMAYGTGGNTGGGTTPVYTGNASRLQFIGSVGPEATGNTVELVLRVVDGNNNTIVGGNFPFQLRVTSSNNDPVGPNGLPSGVTLTLGSTQLIPVNATGGVTGVTVNGLARIRMSYSKSGTVTIEPLRANATTTAYDDQGNVVSTSLTSNSLSVVNHVIRYSVGSTAWNSVKLTGGYSNSSTGLNYANATDIPVPTGGTITLTAGLFDGLNGTGGLVPDGRAGSVRLYKKADLDSNPNAAPAATKAITDGSTTFTISAPSSADQTVQYVVKTEKGVGTVDSNLVTVYTYGSRPTVAPAVRGVRGADENGNARDPYRVGLSDAYLQFLVEPGIPGYGVIKVYKNNSSLIYTSPVVNFAGIHVVNVPKNLLTNQDSYTLYTDNGVGNSLVGTSTDRVTIASAMNVSLNSAYYDAATNRLYVNTNYNSYYSTATLDPSKLIISANGKVFVPSVPKVTSNNSFVVDLTNDPNLNNQNPPQGTASLEDTTVFYGNVRMTALQGWLESSNGAVANEVTQGIAVGPFATVTRSYLDMANNRLIVDTAGITSTSGAGFDLTKFAIGNVLTLSNDSSKFTWQADNTVSGRYIINLRSLTAEQRTALEAVGSDTSVTFDTGWYYAGSNKVAADSAPIYAMMSVRSASYNRNSNVLTINGTGFLTTKPTDGLAMNLITIANDATTPATSFVLDNADNTWRVVNDGQIEITVAGDDQTAMDALSGSLVFLRTAPNWLKDTGNRVAPEITGYQCGVGFSN